MLTEGKHTARVTDLAWQNSQGGTTYLTLRFTATQGDCVNETATKNMFFSEKALKRTVEDLRALGWQGDDPATITVEDLPNEVGIEVEHETFTGRDGEDRLTARVKWINALNALKGNAEQSAVAAFGAQLKARIRALDGAARASGTAPTRPAPQRAPAQRQPPRGFDAGQGDDTDVPF
jgi:hypothetical protein